MADREEKKINLTEIFKASINEAKKKSKNDDPKEKSEKDETDDEEKGENKEEGWSKSNKKSEKEDKKTEKKEDKGKKSDIKIKEEVETDDEEIVDEETLAASSLHPAAKSIPDAKAISASKVSMMNSMMGLMSGMAKDDMVGFFDKVQSQFGPGKTYGVGDNSGKNTSTIDMKASHAVSSSAPKTKDGMPKLDDKGNPLAAINTLGSLGKKISVKEDVEEMFDGEDLSEDFKEKATTLFEAAINARLTVELARLEEEYEETVAEQISTFTEEVSTKLNTYLDYVVENWMEENEVAIESTIRNELMEEFIEGLKNLFSEHYVNVPQDKIDVLESLAIKVGTLEETLDNIITENNELKEERVEGQKKEIIESIASGLTLTQQEKFSSLVEGIEFSGDLEIFKKKLMIVKENYFKIDSTTHNSNINEETFEGSLTEETSSSNDPNVNRYVQAITRTVKK